MKATLNEVRYYEALREIAKSYSTPEQLRRTAERDWGVSYHEALEMAYDNIQATAADAIKGKRRPQMELPAPTPARDRSQK
jgi:hypothetical protein